MTASESTQEDNQKPKTKGQRLHPLSPLFLFIKAVIKLIFPLVIGVVTTSGSTEDYVIFAFAALASLGSILQYWFYRYWLEEDRIIVKSGVLFKSLRQVPYAKIQNLNVQRNLLHRLFGLATLQIESASGKEPEAVMIVITDQQVQQIRHLAKNDPKTNDSLQVDTTTGSNNTQKQHNGTDEEPTDADYFLNTPELIKLGFISHKALLPIAVIFSAIFQRDELIDMFYSWIGYYFGLLSFNSWTWQQWATGISLTAALTLLAVWGSSIALTALKLYQYTLNKRGNKIEAAMGLITRLNASIPIKRIQLMRFRQSPLHRLFKRQTVTIETAGGVNEQTGITMKWLAPLIEPEKKDALLSYLFPDIAWADLTYQPLESRAWKRVFKRTLFFALIPSISAIIYSPWMAFTLLLATIFSYWYAKQFIKTAAYVFNNDVIAYRSGVFFRTTSVAKIEKIQNVTTSQSPFDRWNNMSKISVDTAGSSLTAHHVNIPFLSTRTVDELHKQLAQLIVINKFEW